VVETLQMSEEESHTAENIIECSGDVITQQLAFDEFIRMIIMGRGFHQRCTQSCFRNLDNPN